jgi:Plastocyanin
MVVVSVGNGGNFFSPSNFTIAPGDTVRWIWVAGHHNTSTYSIPAGATAWYSDMDHMTNTFDFTPTISGLYKYTCTYHSGMDAQFFVTGCSYPSIPIITSINSTSCFGDTSVLYTQPQPGATLQWLDGLTLIPGATTDTLKVTTPGNYKVVANRCGVDSASNIVTVNFYSPPTPSYTHSNIGNTYTFTNTTAPLSGSSYVWRFDDGSPDEYTTDVTHSFSTTGTYNVTLVATDIATGCSDSISTPIAYLGVSQTPSTRQYNIYPNPAQSVLHIEATTELAFSLTNITGRSIPIVASLVGSVYYIDVTHIAAGLYIMNITESGNSTLQMVHIQRIN